MAAANTKVAVVAFLLFTMMVATSVPAVTAYHCVNDCVERCSNGKNEASCRTMCQTACIPAGMAEVAKEAAEKTEHVLS